jgi:hypothetical protein
MGEDEEVPMRARPELHFVLGPGLGIRVDEHTTTIYVKDKDEQEAEGEQQAYQTFVVPDEPDPAPTDQVA